jgi:hypothetical protein
MIMRMAKQISHDVVAALGIGFLAILSSASMIFEIWKKILW